MSAEVQMVSYVQGENCWGPGREDLRHALEANRPARSAVARKGWRKQGT